MRLCTRLSLAAVSVALLLPGTTPARAESKEMIQLQTQVQQIIDMLQHLQQSNDERMGVLQHSVEINAENVNRMTQQLTALQGQMEQSAKNDTLSSQVQALNDSVDELRTRIAAVSQQITALQSQMQNVQQAPPVAAPVTPAPSTAPSTPPGPGTGSAMTNPPAAQPSAGGAARLPLTDAPLGPGQIINYTGKPSPGMGASSPAAQALYQSALRDYNGAKYDLAMSEFSDVAKSFPGDPLAGNADYYLGEISFRRGQYPAAIGFYDAVLEQFPGTSRAPAAQLRKAQAELHSDQRDAAIRDLRSLAQRYPASPEGAQARSQLNSMGVRIVAQRSAQ